MRINGHVFRYGAILLSYGIAITFVFWVGWIMGHENYRQEVNSLLEQNKPLEAFRMCSEWFSTSGESPEYYDSVAEIALTQKKFDAALWNLRQARKLRSSHAR